MASFRKPLFKLLGLFHKVYGFQRGKISWYLQSYLSLQSLPSDDSLSLLLPFESITFAQSEEEQVGVVADVKKNEDDDPPPQ